MSILTPFFNLFKPAKTDGVKVSDFNENMDIIDTEMHKPPLTVNGIAPDSTTRDLTITEVPLAGNLSSDIAQVVTGTFVERTSGGDASVSSGEAFLTSIKGNMVHTGQVAESLTIEVNAAERAEGVDPITATIDRDTFVAYVSTSGTITFTYGGSAWTVGGSSVTLSDYGITVSGTPITNDEIVVVYVKEDRGTITVATPAAFNSTGWNLYNSTAGYAKVVKYSEEYGFKLGGSYSLVEFATTVSGTRSAVSMEDGYFNIPADGYVFITGGDSTTYIYATWSDWISGYPGDYQMYTVDTISLSEVMLNFPNGLFAVGAVRDEINLNTQVAINRVQRLTYTAENIAIVENSGVPYEADTNYIYAVLETPVTHSIEIDGDYTVSDHGIEFYSGTTVAPVTEVLYGENLKDKLRTDVLTISAQTLSSGQQAQVMKNIGVSTYMIGQSYTSLSALESALKTYGDSMQNDEVKNIKFTVSSPIGVFPNGVYMGTIKKAAEGRYVVVVQRFSDDGTLFTGNYNSGWSWNSLNNSTISLTEYTDISSYNTDSNLFTIPSDGYVYLSVSSGNNGRALLFGGSSSASYMQMGNAQGGIRLL